MAAAMLVTRSCIACRMLCRLLIVSSLLHYVSGAYLRHTDASSKTGSNRRFLQTPQAASVWPSEHRLGETTTTLPQTTTSATPASSMSSSSESSGSTSDHSSSGQSGSSSSDRSPSTDNAESTGSADKPALSPAESKGNADKPASKAAGPAASATDPVAPTVAEKASSWAAPPPTLPPCEEKVATPVAPVAGIPGFGNMFGAANTTGGCKCNCSQPMNDTAVLHHLMNVAYASADAAQAALEAVGKVHNSSQTARNAEHIASQSQVIWNHLAGTMQRIEDSTDEAKFKLSSIAGAAEASANGYDRAIQQARAMSPAWPPEVR